MENINNKLTKLGPMARRLGVTTRWLRAEAEAGRIPCLKAEDRLLFDADAVQKIMVQRARGEGVY